MEKYAGTQSVARTFTLLKMFDDQTPIWSLPDIIEASGLTRTTTFRLLSALEAEGMVRKNRDGDYTLGTEMIVLGGRAIRANRLRTTAQPFMRQLVQQTKESVTMDMLWIDEQNCPMSVVVEEQLGQYLLGMSQFIGTRFPAHTTSTGKVLLAWQADEWLPTTLSNQPLTTFTPHTLTTADQLRQTLTQIKQQGYATTRDELEMGLTAVAAPIFNHHQQIQAALCIGGPSTRIPPDKLTLFAQHVKETAHQISTRIGYKP